MADWIQSKLQGVHSRLPEEDLRLRMEGSPVSKRFNQIVTNSGSGRHGSTVFTASVTSRTSKRAEKGVKNDVHVYADYVDNNLQHLSDSSRGSIKGSVKHKRLGGQREEERCRELNRAQEEEDEEEDRHCEFIREQEEEERKREMHRRLDAVWQREWKKLQKAVRHEEIRKREVQTLKQAVLQERAKTSSQQPTEEETLQEPLHLNPQRLGEQEAVSEEWTSTESEDEREGEERMGQRGRSSRLKQDRYQIRDIENRNKPLRHEDEMIEEIVERFTAMEAGGAMTTDKANQWETTGSSEIHRDLVINSYRTKGRGGIIDNAEKDQTAAETGHMETYQGFGSKFQQWRMEVGEASLDRQQMIKEAVKQHEEEKRTITRARIVTEGNAWRNKMEEQQEESRHPGTVVKCEKKRVDKGASQRMQEASLSGLDTERGHKKPKRPQRKIGQEEGRIVKAYHDERRRQSQLQEERGEALREKEEEREIKRDGQNEKENQIEVERLLASGGQCEIGRERNELPKQEGMEKQYLRRPEVAAKTQIHRNAKLTEVTGRRSESHSVSQTEAVKHLVQRKGPKPLYQPPVQATSVTKPRTRHMRSKSHPQSSAKLKPATVKDLYVTKITPCTGSVKPNLTEVVDLKAKEYNQVNTGESSRGDHGEETNMCQFLNIVTNRKSGPDGKLEVPNADSMPPETERRVNTQVQVRRGRKSQFQDSGQASDVSDEEIRSDEGIREEILCPPSADVMTREERPGATESTNEASDGVVEGGNARRDKSVRRRILGWVNEKAKNYYQNKISRTFTREIEEGDQAYQSWYMRSPISRAEREQQKRWVLWEAEVRRQRLEKTWLKMEAKRAEKKRKKRQEIFGEIDDTLWFCEDIASKGLKREQFRHTCPPD